MNKSTTRLLFLLMTGCFLHKVKGQRCSMTGTNGIAPCQCNFMEACNAQGNPNPNLAQYLPTGVDQLGLFEHEQQNLAYLCEGGDAWEATNVRLFIVVGAIPSTVRGLPQQRYFGQTGFSDYKDTKGNYRVNVPSDMWTAACCTYSVNGILQYRSTAFWRENNPGNAPCNRADVGYLTEWLSGWITDGTVSFNLFPQTSQCNSKGNYIPLPW